MDALEAFQSVSAWILTRRAFAKPPFEPWPVLFLVLFTRASERVGSQGGNEARVIVDMDPIREAEDDTIPFRAVLFR